VNFVDHGGQGIVAFPDRMLSNTELIEALKEMKIKQMYGKLVFYLEACESGSMFDGLLDPTMSIYATTASSPSESSWGTFCPPDDVINGKTMNTCLGDLYSVSWEENLENMGEIETLETQFILVKKEVNESTVMQYGDLGFTDLPVGTFFGNPKTTNSIPQIPKMNIKSTTVSSHDIPLHLAYYKYLRANLNDFPSRHRLSHQLIEEIIHRNKIDYLFMDLLTLLMGNPSAGYYFQAPAPVPSKCDQCCQYTHQAFEKYCGKYDDYSLQYTRIVLHLCEKFDRETIISTLRKLCQ